MLPFSRTAEAYLVEPVSKLSRIEVIDTNGHFEGHPLAQRVLMLR